MDEVPRIHPNFSDKAQCRLNEINEIKDYCRNSQKRND